MPPVIPRFRCALSASRLVLIRIPILSWASLAPKWSWVALPAEGIRSFAMFQGWEVALRPGNGAAVSPYLPTSEVLLSRAVPSIAPAGPRRRLVYAGAFTEQSAPGFLLVIFDAVFDFFKVRSSSPAQNLSSRAPFLSSRA